jgi:hypothetical protein
VFTDHLGARPPDPNLPSILELEWKAGRRAYKRGPGSFEAPALSYALRAKLSGLLTFF